MCEALITEIKNRIGLADRDEKIAFSENRDDEAYAYGGASAALSDLLDWIESEKMQ